MESCSSDSSVLESDEEFDVSASNPSSDDEIISAEKNSFVQDAISTTMHEITAELNKDLLPFNIDDLRKECTAGRELTLCKRESSTELVRNFVSRLKDSQEMYLKSVYEQYKYFTANLKPCLEMDEALQDVGKSEFITESEQGNSFHRHKDGTFKLHCPINKCSVYTFQLMRHLNNAHPNLSDSCKKCCIVNARKMEKNKIDNPSYEKNDPDTIGKKKKISSRPVHHMSKKNNFVQCSLCDQITSNISQHITSTHKMNPKERNQISSKCNVIPKVLTKYEGKKIILLDGEELEEAKLKYGEEIEKEKEIVHELKESRKMIEDLNHRLRAAKDESLMEIINKELADATKIYKNLRYRDSRKYTDKTGQWRTTFENYLEHCENHNPKRSASMAIDVLLNFETKFGPLTFKDIIGGKKVRQIVLEFRSLNMESASKIKYLRMFSLLLKFLICDCDSPENKSETIQEKLSNGMLFKEASHEIESCIQSLSKKKGEELLNSRDLEKKNLIGEYDMIEMSSQIRKKLLDILADSKETRKQYSLLEITSIRNNLMAIAMINLGRRSMELATMTIEEVSQAQKTVLENGETYLVVEVLNQKSLKSGKKAAVSFKDDEYRVLSIYIQELRSKICPNKKVQCVFPSSAEGGRQMSLGGVWKILSKFSTSSGKKFTSRITRKSIITNTRLHNMSYAEKEATAKAMGHDVATSDRYYATDDLLRSTNQCLSIGKANSNIINSSISSIEDSNFAASTPLRTSEDLPGSSGISKKRHLPMESVAKRKITFDDSETDDQDITIKQLRSKKLRTGTADEMKLEKKIQEIVEILKRSGKLDALYSSKKGIISVKYINEQLPKELRSKFSIKHIRRVTEKEVNLV